MNVHIYRAKSQPATRFKTDFGNFSMTTRYKRRTQLWANCCKKRRWATHLFAHVYYDGTWFYCRPGRGCKHAR